MQRCKSRRRSPCSGLATRAIEPKTFSEHWYKCLRALGLRVRGLYCIKGTSTSHALRTVGSVEWVETQTGVAYATLKKHYAKWLLSRDEWNFDDSWTRLRPKGPKLTSTPMLPGHQFLQLRNILPQKECEEGDLNPHGCYPTSPSN